MIDQNSAALNPEVIDPDGLSPGARSRAGVAPVEAESTDPDGLSPEELSAQELSPDLGPMHWTGRMEFDLSDAQGWRIGTVEIVIRIDHLSLWFGNRTLAVMDRDLFREWLIDPGEPF